MWDAIRLEFTRPTLSQVPRRLSELMENPEPVMQQLGRVFIDAGTFWRPRSPCCVRWNPTAGARTGS